MDDVLAGLDLMWTARPMLLLLAGVVVGFIAGVLPGLGATNTVALLLPFSLTLPFEESLILMSAIYCGVGYGGSIPAILLRVGDAGSAATALDGYPMTQKGQGDLAIGISRMASATAGFFGGIVVLVTIGFLGDVALSFGSRELFLVAVFGLTIVTAVTGRDIAKGMLSGLLGLLMASMSAAAGSAQARFTFGLPLLYEGVPLAPAIIGLFAFSEMFLISRKQSLIEDAAAAADRKSSRLESMASVMEGIRVTLRHKRVLMRSTLIGMVVGLIPGTGSTVSNFISYADARRHSKTPERFGTGIPEGVIASEAADNALNGTTLVPLLTLGVPGGGVTAVMLGALLLQGIQPGPRMLLDYGPEAYAILWSVVVASFLILPLGILIGGPLSRISYASPATIVPSVLLFCTLGTLALRGQLFDVWVALVFGLLAIAMRQSGYPIVPLILGLILGPLAELNLVRALDIGGGDVGYLFASPTAVVMWVLIVASLVYGLRKERQARRRTAVSDLDDAMVGS